jgi:large subunit ribosomal protein L25
MTTLKAEKRNRSIKAKKLRREGFVTGNIFGKEIEGSMPIQMEQSVVERLLKTSTRGSRVLLEVAGKKIPALIKEIDFDSMKHQVLEIDFQALVKGEKVHSVAEVVLNNHEKVATGVVEKVLSEISYKALPEALVEKVEIDVSALRVGDSLKVRDLPIASDKNVDLMTDLDAVVVTVFEAHNAAVEETEEKEKAGE